MSTPELPPPSHSARHQDNPVQNQDGGLELPAYDRGWPATAEEVEKRRRERRRTRAGGKEEDEEMGKVLRAGEVVAHSLTLELVSELMQ